MVTVKSKSTDRSTSEKLAIYSVNRSHNIITEPVCHRYHPVIQSTAQTTESSLFFPPSITATFDLALPYLLNNTDLHPESPAQLGVVTIIPTRYSVPETT